MSGTKVIGKRVGYRSVEGASCSCSQEESRADAADELEQRPKPLLAGFWNRSNTGKNSDTGSKHKRRTGCRRPFPVELDVALRRDKD